MFVERSITTYENNSFQAVQLMRDSPIRQNVSVRVVGGKDYDLLVRKIPKFLEHFHQFFLLQDPIDYSSLSKHLELMLTHLLLSEPTDPIK